jgi:hypothetical protein
MQVNLGQNLLNQDSTKKLNEALDPFAREPEASFLAEPQTQRISMLVKYVQAVSPSLRAPASFTSALRFLQF